MSPRILDTRRCPHCKAELPDPTPRSCPSCGGSLQQRHLRMGCLTSAPKILLVGFAVWWIGELLAAAMRG